MGQLGSDVLDVLRHHIAIDSAKRTVRITQDLDPGLYGRVSAVLTGLGGKYAGVHAKGTSRHAFKVDPAPLIAMALTTGEDNPGDFFATPDALADYVAACLDVPGLPRGAVVLEPHYGTGALARAVERAVQAAGRGDVQILGIEQNPGLAAAAGPRVACADLLAVAAPLMPITAAVMNPPFGKRAAGPDDWSDPDVYIRHILRVWSWLPPGGRLVAVAPSGWTFRGQGKAVTLPALLDGETRLSLPQFRAFVDRYGRHVKTRGKLFEATDIPVTVIVLGTVADEPPPMPELPAELAPEGRVYKDPTQGKSLETLMAELDESERASHEAMLSLKRTMADLLYPKGYQGERCPACAGPVEGGQHDARGREWHPDCVRMVLSQYTPAQAGMDRAMTAIEQQVTAASEVIDGVAASIELPPRPVRGRRVSVPAEGQLVLEL